MPERRVADARAMENRIVNSIRAVSAGLIAEVVFAFAFYGVAQLAGSSDLLTIVFLAALALVGVVSTYVPNRVATPGIGRLVTTLASALLFATLLVLAGASLVSLQDG